MQMLSANERMTKQREAKAVLEAEREAKHTRSSKLIQGIENILNESELI